MCCYWQNERFISARKGYISFRQADQRGQTVVQCCVSSVISSSRLPVTATAMKSTGMESATMEMTRSEMMAIEVVSPIPARQ
jgi:hypothetical protein